MAVSDEFHEYILGQLAYIGQVTSRRMFGGVGIYRHQDFFALIDDDVLYFKVDDVNRDDYLKANMPPFRPYGAQGYAMQYYEVPVEVLEDSERLSGWAMKAVEVARRKKKKK
jgi:DNA transformation protein